MRCVAGLDHGLDHALRQRDAWIVDMRAGGYSLRANPRLRPSAGSVAVGFQKGVSDEPSARLIDRLEHERPRPLAGIVAEHRCLAWLYNPHEKAVLCLWRHREDVAGLDPLESRNDPRRARDASVVQAVVPVPASAPALYLHKPRPDLSGVSPDRDGVIPPDLGVGNQIVARRDRLDGLSDEPRPGVPRTITDAQVEEVVVRTLEEVLHPRRTSGSTHFSSGRKASMTRGVSVLCDVGVPRLRKPGRSYGRRTAVVAVGSRSRIARFYGQHHDTGRRCA